MCALVVGVEAKPPPQPPAPNGDYSIAVSAPVCGTGSSGSIPGSRPTEEKYQTVFVWYFSMKGGYRA
ncbi:MAG: hypothetical protein RLZZ230_144 [Candidatus Parcubacteria bacterium]